VILRGPEQEGIPPDLTMPVVQYQRDDETWYRRMERDLGMAIRPKN
jgi:hypothetical protein